MSRTSWRDIQRIQNSEVVFPEYLYIESIQVRAAEQVDESILGGWRIQNKGAVLI